MLDCTKRTKKKPLPFPEMISLLVFMNSSKNNPPCNLSFQFDYLTEGSKNGGYDYLVTIFNITISSSFKTFYRILFVSDTLPKFRFTFKASFLKSYWAFDNAHILVYASFGTFLI